MKIFREYSQCQGLLLPPSLDEFVPEDHEARIVNEVVENGIPDIADVTTSVAQWISDGTNSGKIKDIWPA